MKRVLIVVAVDAEAAAIPPMPGVEVVVGGVGRTNAAAVTTETLLQHGPFSAALSVGVAGSLPGGPLELGQAVVASSCVYAEEGMIGPDGFVPLASFGLSLGDFPGNAVPVDARLLERLTASKDVAVGPIATVATCSGTDEAARSIATRTGAIAEAMEGAAVVHAARRLSIPAIELRVISNTTGDRRRQRWDLRGALHALGDVVADAVERLG